MDQDDRLHVTLGAPGQVPGNPPEHPPAFIATPAGPTTPDGPPDGPSDGRPGPPAQGPRPLPLITSLAGAAGAAFLLVSLGLFLSEVGGDSRRLGGLVACLLFQGLGVGLMVLTRGRTSTTAGVGLTALAIIPLVVYLFVDVDNPGKTVNSPSDFTGTATLILLASAAAWLVAYFVGPGRRYGIYLGGALLALWLVAVVQIVDNPVGQLLDPFGTQAQAQAQFTPVGPAIGPDDSFSDTGAEDDFFMPSQDDEFGPGFDDDYGMYGDPYGSLEDPSAKLGWASLLFGGGYLALAAWRDRRGDGRMGTPLIAVSAPILLLSIAFLSGDFGDTGTPMLAIAIGAAQMFVGTRQGRRFTSWIGLLVATFGTVGLVGQAVGDSAKVSAIVLLVLGVGITILALALDGGLHLDRGDGPSGPTGPAIPPGGGGGSAIATPAHGGVPWTSAGNPNEPVTATGSPWATPAEPPLAPPSAPDGPPTTQSGQLPASWQSPPMEAPAAPPWTPPAPGSAALWAPPTPGQSESPDDNP